MHSEGLIMILQMQYMVLLGIVFILSGTEKLAKQEEHRRLLFNYQILSMKQIKRFLPVLASLEILIGLLLFSLQLSKVAIVGAVGLMLIFTGAIAINLFRGRKDISCGCGGVMGNHKISWWLVVRNGCISLGFVLCLPFEESIKSIGLYYGVACFSAIFIILCSLIIKNLSTVQGEINRIMGKDLIR